MSPTQRIVEAVRKVGWQRHLNPWIDLLGRLDHEFGPGQSTAVVVAVHEQQLLGASVGDSQAWWLMGNAQHHLTGEQKRKPLLGMGSAGPVGFLFEVRNAGTLVLGSDGLANYLKWERLSEALTGTAEIAARRLVEAARFPSARSKSPRNFPSQGGRKRFVPIRG